MGEKYSFSRGVIAFVIVTVIASGGIAQFSELSAAQGPGLTIEVTTTETNAPAKTIVKDHQPIRLHLEYSGLGSGTHELEIRESDTLVNDVVREFTVQGDSGSETFTLSPSELAETDESAEPAATLFVKWGDETSNSVNLPWLRTTVYTDGYGEIPDVVEHGEEITIRYYGWTRAQETHVLLLEDDPPHNAGGGNDEQIRREVVSGPGYFEGTFTFTPSDYVGDGEEEDSELEIQARAEDRSLWPDIVRAIAVSQDTPTATPTPEPELGARITSINVQSGSYNSGQEVSAEVEVENMGDLAHEFFIGFGAIDESGTIYDNDGTTGTTIQLEPGEEKTAVVEWAVEDDAPTGGYDVGAAVWLESNPDNLETRLDQLVRDDAFSVVETPTPTPTPSPTPTSTSSPTPTPTDNSASQAESGSTATSPQTSGSEQTEPEDSDGDGVIDSNDYAPNDPDVQEEDDIETNVEVPGFGFGAALVAVFILIGLRLGLK